MEQGDCDRLAKGVAALEAGRRAEAREWLARAVRADPANATAWLWLSRCVDDERQRQDCLERFTRLQKRLQKAGPQAARPPSHTPVRATGRSPLPSHTPVRATGWSPLPSHSHTLPPATRHSPLTTRRWLRLVALVLAIAVLVYIVIVHVLPAASGVRHGWGNARTLARGQGEDGGIEASGVIQAEEVRVASEYGGLIVRIPVREGEAVSAGDLLLQLDTALVDARIEAARAAVALAEAGLDRARAGARPGQIALAEAQLAQAEAARLAAAQAVSDTLALLADPQEVRLQIAVTQAQVQAQGQRVAQALALKDAAEIGKDKFQEAQAEIAAAGGPGRHRVPIPGHPGLFYEYTVPALPLEMHLMPNAWWQAWVGVNAAAAQQEGLEASLAYLHALRAHPQDLEANVDAARAALAQAVAQVAATQARLDGLRAGATDEQIAALEARVAQAQAALDALLSQRERMQIRSPMDGVVVDLAARPGEVAAPGAALLTLADLDLVRLTVYLPEMQIGQVRLGQGVQVAVDSFPGRVFEGQVTHIAGRAQFTPRNVATQEERINLVFAVEILLPNADRALKPGMPADARMGEINKATRVAPYSLLPTSYSLLEVVQRGGEKGLLTASGTIEGHEVRLASEPGGRIVEVRVREGDRVQAGDPLVFLDATPLLDRLAEAEAAAAAAEADLAVVRTWPRQEEIAAARAALALAEAQRDGARAAWENARQAIANPQALDAQIIDARTQVELAGQGIILAQAGLDRERLLQDQKPGGSFERDVADWQVRAAQAELAAAQADLAAAQALLDGLQGIRSRPLGLIAQAHAAEGQYRAAEAGVAAAQASLDDLLAGPTAEEIAVAGQAARLARAQAGVLRAQGDRFVLASPVDGVVLSQVLRAGEVAAPAATILSLADLGQVTLVVYVPVDRVGQVQVGQEVQVTVDSFPDRAFAGRVSRISDQPEFTPRNVATKEERLNTFYAVEIDLPNPEGLLKPGMPADATF